MRVPQPDCLYVYHLLLFLIECSDQPLGVNTYAWKSLNRATKYWFGLHKRGQGENDNKISIDIKILLQLTFNTSVEKIRSKETLFVLIILPCGR